MSIKLPQVAIAKVSGKVPLRTVLVVPFVLQIFAAVGLVGWLSWSNGQVAVNDLAAQLRSEISDRIHQHLETYTAVPLLINEMNASALRQGLLNLSDPKSMELHFWEQGKLFKGMGTIAFANEFGDFVGANRSEGYITFADESTGKALRRYSVDEQGNYLQLIRSRPNYDPRKRSWYKIALQVGHTTWTPLEASFSSRRLDATTVSPFYDKTGTLRGVFMAEHSASQINDFLRELKIGKSGQTFIIERSGLLVASSSQQQPFVIKGQEIERLEAENSEDSLIKFAAKNLKIRFGDFTKIQKPLQFEFAINKQRQFAQIVPFSNQKGLDWLIIVVVPEADFMEQINANSRTTIFLCFGALVLAILLGILTARWITQPIRRLKAASMAIADGELNQKVEVKIINELRALAQSFNKMAQQLRESFTALEQANAELEQRVEQRTGELKLANQEIMQLNQRLKAENLRMSAELEVTRKLQQMILPTEEELNQISELDIVGFMEPAAEVGGDYYDVVHQDGHIKISIGDVTGHGLESGLLAIMVQAALRALLANHETDPVQILKTLNRTVYDNVQRMNLDKILTISLLDYFQNTLILSGQHEEMIVIRAGSDSNPRVEKIETEYLGMPLGLEPDIANFLNSTQVELQSGDVVILYTDGITEAENIHHVQYSLDQLIKIVKQNWQHSAREIRQAIIDDLRQHIGEQKVDDDITLVVFKQK
ncbi:MAG: SpoIIE family protein phosphatase [Actinomycetota bacterium]